MTRIYTVHVRRARSGATADRDLVLVKEGFSWPAFFFTLLWALWHRLWLFAVLIAASGVALGLAVEYFQLGPVLETALGLAWSVLIGFEANDLRRRALAWRGFALTDVVMGRSLAAAEHRFFTKHHPFAATI
jgi:hypothetical protein